MADHDPEVGQEEDVNAECVGDVQAEDACAKGSADDMCPDEAVERDGAVVDEVNRGLGAETGEPDQAETEEVEVGAVQDTGDGAHGTVECEGGEPVEGKTNIMLHALLRFVTFVCYDFADADPVGTDAIGVGEHENAEGACDEMVSWHSCCSPMPRPLLFSALIFYLIAMILQSIRLFRCHSRLLTLLLQDERKESEPTSAIEALADEAAKAEECEDVGNDGSGGGVVDATDSGEGVDGNVAATAYTHTAAEEDAAAAIHAAASVAVHDGGGDGGEDDEDGDGDGDGDDDPRQGGAPGDRHLMHGGDKSSANGGVGGVGGGGMSGSDLLDAAAHHHAHQVQQAGVSESSPGGELGKGKRPPGRPKGAKDSRPRTRRRKAEISAIRNATSAGLPVGGMSMGGMGGFGHHHPVFSPHHHHHLGGGHDLGFQSMHGVDMGGYGRPGASFQGLRGMWPGGGDGSMGGGDGSMGGGGPGGGHALSYKSIADPSRGLGGPGGDVWPRGMTHAAAAAAQGFADPSAHMSQMYGGGGGGGMDPYGFQGRGGGGMYATDGPSHYDPSGRYAAQPYGMSMMSMPGGGGGGGGMGMKPPPQAHVGGGGHGGLGRPHGSYGQLGRMDDGQDGSQDPQVRGERVACRGCAIRFDS